jgi:putative spermidine/putrescine transport system permease protein
MTDPDSIRTGHEGAGRGRPVALLLLPALLLVAAFFAYPILDLMKASLFDPDFTTAHFVKFFTQNLYWRVSFNTVETAFVTTLLCAVIGYPAAWFLAHSPQKLRPFLIFLILLPMWVSVLIRSYAWMAVLGREGIINSLLMGTGLISEPFAMLYTTGAVHLAMVQILLPIMILTCYGVMREIEPDLLKAAHVLGAGRFRAFLHVYLPLSLSGLRNGAVVIFILSMGYFITPELVGGRKDMMIGNLIVFQIDKLANWGFASAIGIILLIATIAMVLLLRAGLDRAVPSAGRAE